MIGLGRMGGPMTDRVIAAGHEVRVVDVSPAAVAPRVEAGATAAATPADAARGASFVGVVVLDDAQATEVIAGSGGVLHALEPGSVVAVHTTVSLTTFHALSELGRRYDIDVLDAGISGGEPGAQRGTLLTMVGGEVAAVERARPVMECYSKEVLHAGPAGAGMALKLARNAVGYAMMAAVHDALELTHRSGIDVALLRHVIAETGVFDQSLAPLSFGGPDPLPDGAPPEFRSILEHTDRLAAKDLEQALDLARELGASVPVIEVTRAGFSRVMRRAG